MSSYNIFIKSLTGNTFVLNIEPNNSIKNLKERIQNVENIELEYQRLMFGGKQLENDKSVLDYNIEKNNTLHLLSSLKGGFQRVYILSQNEYSNILGIFTNIRQCRKFILSLTNQENILLHETRLNEPSEKRINVTKMLIIKEADLKNMEKQKQLKLEKTGGVELDPETIEKQKQLKKEQELVKIEKRKQKQQKRHAKKNAEKLKLLEISKSIESSLRIKK